MQDGPSSKPNGVKLTNFHVLVSSLAAIAGVVIAGYQTFGTSNTTQLPVNVTVSLDQQKANANAAVAAGELQVEKSDAMPALATEAVDLAREASFAAALKDDSASRYSFGNLFDGQDDTFLAINKPDNELNILVTFKGSETRPVTAIEYVPPVGVDPSRLATTVDIMVLPEGQLEASGRQVMSFTLPQSPEPHTFAIPGRAEGKGVWLRIAGNGTADKSFVGDFRILSESVAP